MKKIHFSLVALSMALIGTVSAASYTVTNSSGGSTTQSVVTATGGFVTNGQALFGYYSTNRDAAIGIATTTADILLNFVLVGSGSIAPTAGATPIQGVFAASGTTEDLSAPGNATAGKNIYVLFGNNSVFSNSTQAAVLKMSILFASSEPTTSTVSIRNSTTPTSPNGTMLLGAHNVFSGDPTPTSAAPTPLAPFYSLSNLVPEPSSALLGALGALGLLRRRRI